MANPMIITGILMFVAILFICDLSLLTLSPPAKGHHKREKEKIVAKTGSTDQDVFEKNLLSEHLKASNIIREAGLYSSETRNRRFFGDVLGYITPWNNRGYDIAKLFHGKFTMISPVWLSFPLGNVSTFQLSTHDVKKKWLKEMRDLDNQDHTVKILPRVLFEHWSANDILRLQTESRRQQQLIKTLTNTAKNFNFDGYVLEMWTQFLFSGVNVHTVTSIVASIAKTLRDNNLDVILVVPPSRGENVPIFSSDEFDALAPYVTAFSLMTYDFSSIQRPGPNSPLAWAKQCVEMLVPQNGDPRRSQILLGINFYGYSYTPSGGGAIVGDQYLRHLESVKGKIEWDDQSKEHFFAFRTSDESGFVFYPTLYSINHRLDLAKDLDTGISIWELGQGLNYFYDLL